MRAKLADAFEVPDFQKVQRIIHRHDGPLYTAPAARLPLPEVGESASSDALQILKNSKESSDMPSRSVVTSPISERIGSYAMRVAEHAA
jgi:hypothetical protein